MKNTTLALYFAESGFAFLGLGLADIYLLAGIISIIVSLFFGGIQVWLLVKAAKKDGVITDEEKKEILSKTDETISYATEKAKEIINRKDDLTK